MKDFYRELRKAELHVHLEGSVLPETAMELDPSLSLDDVRARYRFDDFEGFIRSYIWVNRLLKSPADYALITRRLLQRMHAETIVYAEINLSVGVMLWKEQDVHGILQAIFDEAARSPVAVRWIFDAIRQFGAESGQRVAELAVEYRDRGVAGFGIGGHEQLGPCSWFGEVFRFAAAEGIAIVPHAGETAGPESIWSAVQLGAKRIGHGIRAVEDEELLLHLREHEIPLEVCITSNVCTGAVPSLDAHPVRRLFDAGVPITLNTDDPALFGTTLSAEYELAATHFGFTHAELAAIADNAFKYAVPSATSLQHRT